MIESGPELGQVRLDNALALFEEFVRQTARHADAATCAGWNGVSPNGCKIQPSYWSQIKSRSRQIGERLARQFEHLCHKPRGWMDVAHGSGGNAMVAGARDTEPADDNAPRDDDERFIVGLVLTYYRRHPQRARTRLLDLLGEVLTPQPGPPPPTAAAAPGRAPAGEPDLWRKVQAGVAPLKPKKR